MAEKKWDCTFDVNDADVILGNGAEGIGVALAMNIPNPFLQALAFSTSQYIMLQVSQVVFEGVSGVTVGNASALALAQIKVGEN